MLRTWFGTKGDAPHPYPKSIQENIEIPQTSQSPHTIFLKMTLMHSDTTEMILQTISVLTKIKEKLKDVSHFRLAGFCTSWINLHYPKFHVLRCINSGNQHIPVWSNWFFTGQPRNLKTRIISCFPIKIIFIFTPLNDSMMWKKPERVSIRDCTHS